MKTILLDKIENKAKEMLISEDIKVDDKAGITHEDCLKICHEYDAMIVRSGFKITKDVIDASKKLKVIVRAGVGVDNIDLESAKEKGVAVENTPYGNINAAAEHTITLLLMLAKHVIHSHNELKKGVWNRKHKGTELKEKTLGIIGFGKVGKKVAKVAAALEMKVICFDPFVKSEAMEKENIKKAELNEILQDSDYITVHVPLTKETKNMISKKEFSLMKKGVRILNIARGGVIDEEALEEALNNEIVSAAALDVYEQEPPMKRSLIENDKVICTPHLGASTKEAQENVGIDAAYQVISALKKGEIINCVNGVTKIRE